MTDRFVVNVDSSWQASLAAPDGTTLGQPRQLTKAKDSDDEPYPRPPEGEPNHEGFGADSDEWSDQFEAVTGKHLGPSGDMALFGQYLFDVLVGETWWNLIEQKTQGDIELALQFSPGDRAFGRLPWEMMFRNDKPLMTDVAITRLVESKAEPKQNHHCPPRMLFVVGGKPGDSELRPGAEFGDLLRCQRHEDVAFDIKLLKKGSVDALTEAVKAYHPDIVHFVCHGGASLGTAYLKLYDKETRQLIARDATQLLTCLETSLPSVVVLSACNSGAPNPDHEARSLAEELVKGGIPIVIGMSGKVTDVACRLFTVCFGRALLSGEPIIEASARGRKAALAGMDNLSKKSVDWARPALFMASGISPDFSLPSADSNGDWALISQWLRRRDVKKMPVRVADTGMPAFCARFEAMEKYEQLMAGQIGPALLFSDGASSSLGKVGKTRILQELIARTTRSGHIPVPILKESKNPRKQGHLTLEDFARKMDDAISDTREAYELDDSKDSQTFLVLTKEVSDLVQDEKIDKKIRRMLSKNSEKSPEVFRRAFALDLLCLQQDAHLKHELLKSCNAEVLVFLDSIQDLDTQTLGSLFAVFLGSRGFGIDGNTIKIVMTGKEDQNTGSFFKDAKETGAHIKVKKLEKLEADVIISACKHVLLHPFRSPELEIEDKAWSFKDDIDQETREKRQAVLSRAVSGFPSTFNEEKFWMAVFALTFDCLEEAKDNEFLKDYGDNGP